MISNVPLYAFWSMVYIVVITLLWIAIFPEDWGINKEWTPADIKECVMWFDGESHIIIDGSGGVIRCGVFVQPDSTKRPKLIYRDKK